MKLRSGKTYPSQNKSSKFDINNIDVSGLQVYKTSAQKLVDKMANMEITNNRRSGRTKKSVKFYLY